MKQIRLEFDATLREVRWRLIELSRRLTLQGLTLSSNEAVLLLPLRAALAQEV